MRHCGNMGVEQTPNKGQHTNLTLPLLLGLELATFWSQIQCSFNKLSWLLRLTATPSSLFHTASSSNTLNTPYAPIRTNTYNLLPICHKTVEQSPTQSILGWHPHSLQSCLCWGRPAEFRWLAFTFRCLLLILQNDCWKGDIPLGWLPITLHAFGQHCLSHIKFYFPPAAYKLHFFYN